ncbi:MAG: hypothetical protein MJ053_06840 [Elusimicrobiaceae bacterium]|nr:hypothetical protein [Elusimicrobiaceae bacterium]
MKTKEEKIEEKFCAMMTELAPVALIGLAIELGVDVFQPGDNPTPYDAADIVAGIADAFGAAPMKRKREVIKLMERTIKIHAAADRINRARGVRTNGTTTKN